MKKLKKIKLNEEEILTRLNKGDMKNLIGGVYDGLLACGGDSWKQKACDKCLA